MSRAPLPAAPGEAEHLALRLANSMVSMPGEVVADALDSPDAATGWLVEHGLAQTGTALLPYCQSRLTELRTHVREVLSSHAHQAAPAPASLTAINMALATGAAQPALEFSASTGFRRVATHPTTSIVEYAMAGIAGDLAALVADHQQEPLLQCAAPPCDRFFIRTHARRRWCSTRCGDRVRAARAHARALHAEQIDDVQERDVARETT